MITPIVALHLPPLSPFIFKEVVKPDPFSFYLAGM